MELQWPLIVFTTLVAWSAGLFGTQALMAAFGVGKKAQVPAWIASAVLLAVGGIAVFFHLEHWERIFNGFGTSRPASPRSSSDAWRWPSSSWCGS